MMTIKISEETFKKLAAQSPSDAEASILALLENQDKALEANDALAAEAKELDQTFSNLIEKVEALEKRVSAVEANGGQINTVEIIQKAEAAASKVAASAIAKTGTAPVNPSPNQGTQDTGKIGFAELFKGKVAAGKSRSEAMTETINQFPKEYAAWREAGCKL